MDKFTNNHESEITMFLKFLNNQFPGKTFDLEKAYELLNKFNMLIEYDIKPPRLEALLKFNRAAPDFRLFAEENVDSEVYAKIAANLEILLYKQGQLHTLTIKKPVDAEQMPVPWITYPALEFLEQFDYSRSSVFEYGSGNSTFFWAKRALEVISLETEREWFLLLSNEKPHNVTLHLQETLEDFTNLILRYEKKFDVIVIDSMKFRYDAVKNAMTKISDGGLIVFDNSDWYPNSCALLRNAGFSQIDFHGFGPVNNYAWTTSVFIGDRINLNRTERELYPVGGQKVQHEDDKSAK